MRPTSSPLWRWRQLDPPHRTVITWLTVFLMLVLTLSVMATLDPSEDSNALAASTTTTTSRTATPVAVQIVTVAVVVDGRTIIGSDGEQLVVEGLGQPGQCWAVAALNFAKITLLGKRVQVDADIVRLPDGEDFAVLMAGRGLGRVKAGARTAVGDAQEMAKLAKLGLWGAPCEGSDAAPPSSSPLPPTVDGTSVPSPPPAPTATQAPKPTPPRKLARSGWVASASSEEMEGDNGWAANVLDGNSSTFWHSRWKTAATALPQWVTIDMRTSQRVSGLVYTPRSGQTNGSANGRIGRYEIQLSADGATWGAPVVSGTLADDASVKTIGFAVGTARYVRLVSLSEAGGRGPWATAAEIELLG